jgi:predicted DNA-binding transcriptional regulator YafY
VSGIDRVLSFIDLFTEAQSVWTAEALIQMQGTSRATTYRDRKVSSLRASSRQLPKVPMRSVRGHRTRSSASTR